MLPKFLKSSFKQYKEDSDAVATWLATTAQKCGYAKDLLFKEDQSSQKAPKLRGRARKLARDAAKAGAPQPSLAQPSKGYLISVDDFISLAEWITKTTPRIEVPASFNSVLNRAITVRKRHHSYWYGQTEQNKADPELRKANEGHGYFIGVLEKVREVLRPRMPTDVIKDSLAQSTATRRASDADTSSNIVNLFHNLDLEDTVIPSDNDDPSRESASAEHPKVEWTTKQSTESELEEVYFAVHCLFNDFHNLRHYIQAVWKGYKAGAFDLVAVSLVTNTAIDLARSLQEDFEETFPNYTDFEKHINVLFLQLCLAAGTDPLSKERLDDEMNFAVYNEAEEIFFPTYMLLSSFCDVLKAVPLPIYKPGTYGIYNASSNRNSKSAREKFREDKIIMLEALPEFCLLARSDQVLGEDELTRGVRQMVKTKQVPMWLTFAAQIFLDIHHIFRAEVEKGFHDFVRSSKFIETNINQVLTFHEKLRVHNWPRSNDQGLQLILNQVDDWAKADMLQKIRARLTKSAGMPVPQPFFLIRQHPLLCGLLSYAIRANAEEASIVFVNAWGSVLYSAHLYNAVKQEGMLNASWKDMDLALHLHETKDMFVGDFPKTVDDYFKRFTLAVGYSASNFAKDRGRSGKVAASRAGPRSLDSAIRVSNMFKDRYCNYSGRTNLSLDDVETILATGADTKSDFIDEQLKTAINVPGESANGALNEAEVSKTDKSAKAKKLSAAEGLRPVQLLNALLDALGDEMLPLSFDHFGLHMSCWRLLREVHEALSPDLKNMYEAGYLDQENQLPFVVGYIFMAAVSTKRLGGVLMPKKQDMVTSKLLTKAGEVLEAWLEKGNGTVGCMMLEQWLGMEVEIADHLTVEPA